MLHKEKKLLLDPTQIPIITIFPIRREYDERIKKVQVSYIKGFKGWCIRTNITVALHV